MTSGELLRTRFFNQHLTKPIYTKPEEIVRHLLAVQSQDYANAKWAVGQRLVDATDETVEQAFTQGRILRTHVMRPTWHFVTPADIRWLLELTAPRIRVLMTYYDRKLGIDETLKRRTQKIFENNLRNGSYLTRGELAEKLADEKIEMKGQMLAHVVMHAELDAVICSGPRRGKQFTYALLDERVPPAKSMSRDESLAELTKRYVRSQGPATIQDLSWWSGLTVSDIKEGIALCGGLLHKEEMNGREYWFMPVEAPSIPPGVYLLPNYDEYTIAYKNRDDFFRPEDSNKSMDARAYAIFNHTIVSQGVVVGLWRRIAKGKSIDIETKFFENATVSDKSEIATATQKYCRFYGIGLR